MEKNCLQFLSDLDRVICRIISSYNWLETLSKTDALLIDGFWLILNFPLLLLLWNYIYTYSITKWDRVKYSVLRVNTQTWYHVSLIKNMDTIECDIHFYLNIEDFTAAPLLRFCSHKRSTINLTTYTFTEDRQHNPTLPRKSYIGLFLKLSYACKTSYRRHSIFHPRPCLTVSVFKRSPSGRLILQDLGYFSAVDAGSGNGRGGDESEHVAARGSHGGRHRRSRARRWPDALVAAPATVEPTCGCLSPRFTRRGHPRQSGGDHVEFLVRYGHRRVAENRPVVSVGLARDRTRLPKLSRIRIAGRIFWSMPDQGDWSRFRWESRTHAALVMSTRRRCVATCKSSSWKDTRRRNSRGSDGIFGVEQIGHWFRENFTSLREWRRERNQISMQ